ncbi:unnamed protein product [Prunus brigantina]
MKEFYYKNNSQTNKEIYDYWTQFKKNPLGKMMFKNKHPRDNNNTRQHSILSRSHHPWTWFLRVHDEQKQDLEHLLWDNQQVAEPARKKVPVPVLSNKVGDEGMLLLLLN